MDAIVCHPAAGEYLVALSLELRERTRRRAEEVDGRSYPRYTPWLCARPVQEETVDPLFLQMEYNPGELITDRDRLTQIDEYLRGSGSLLTHGMPVMYDEWPVMVDIARSRPDAVAAFHEGLALVFSSPFLKELFPYLVDFVVPQRRQRPSGFDSAMARGVVFRTFPAGETGLLAGFQVAHAMGHQAAILLQSVDDIFESNRFDDIQYEVRNDARTADHAFVSAVALAYMVILSHALYGRRARPFIAAAHVRGYAEYLPDALERAVQSITSQTSLTPVGKMAMDEIRQLAG